MKNSYYLILFLLLSSCALISKDRSESRYLASKLSCSKILSSTNRSIKKDVLDLSALPNTSKEVYSNVINLGKGHLIGGWNTTRGLKEVYEELGAHQTALMSSLQRISYGDGRLIEPAATRWLDIGTGTGQMLKDFRTTTTETNAAHKIELIGIEPNFDGKLTGGTWSGQPSLYNSSQAKGFLKPKNANSNVDLSIVSKFFEEVPNQQLGTFGLITSVRAATYYTPEVTFVLNKMLRLRGIVNRTIFDIHNGDVVKTSKGDIRLVDWLEIELKKIAPRVEIVPSGKHSEISVFLITDMNLNSPSGQLPSLKYGGLHGNDNRRVFLINH